MDLERLAVLVLADPDLPAPAAAHGLLGRSVAAEPSSVAVFGAVPMLVA